MVQARLKLGLRGGIWCWGRWGRWATMGLAGMAGLAGLVSVARVSSLHAADDDYAFVVKLLSPEFEMDQMAATQIQQMGQVQTPEGQFDYKLAQAYQDIAQAESGDVAPGPSSDLMSAAKKLLEDLSTDAKAKGYRNYDAAVKLQGTIKTKTIDMMISDAKMIEDDDPKKAEQLREQAAAAYDDLFQAEKTVMVDADKQWFPNITKMGEFFKKHENDEGDVKLPPDIAQGVMEAWMHIMPPCNEWANYGLLAMKYYSATNPRRALIRTDICTYFTEKANNEYADNELVTMTFFEFMGEACGYMDDLKAMNDNLDNVWQVNPNEYPNPAAKQLVLEIKKRAAFFMVDLNMQKKNYQEVIDRINRILFDAPTMWETDMGKQLIFDLAKAECLLPNGPDYEDAKDQIVNLMGKMAETDPWMNNARRALSEVVDLAQQHGVMLSMPGQRWYDAGRGLFQLASVDEQQAEAFTKDNKADRAAKLNEQARPLFFTAIKFYRNAISAERQGEAPLTERMAVEGNAWNEMAFAYLKLKLQYESMLAFKGLVETFRDESLKALVKVSRNPEDQTLLTRPTDEQKKSLTDIDAKLKEARKDMVAIASTIYGETPTNYNREIKAEIIKYVEGGSENDFGNTTHEFQLAQLAYDAATGDKSNGMAYRGAGGEDNLKRSQEQFEESYANFVKAAGMFAQIPTSNASYESSLYMSAASYYQAYLLYAQDTLKVDADARKAKLQETGPKVIEAFDNYVKFAESDAAKKMVMVDADLARRKRFEAAAYMTEPAVLMYLERYDEALAKIKEFYKYAQANPGVADAKQLDNVNWTQYLIYYKQFVSLPLETGKVTPATLSQMDMVINECRLMAERLDKSSPRYNEAAGSISTMAAKGVEAIDALVAGDSSMEAQVAGLRSKFDRFSATWFEAYLEGRDPSTVSIDAYYEAAARYKAAGMPDKAAGMYRRILDIFDKNNTGVRIPDQVLIEEIFKPMWTMSAERPHTPYLKLRDQMSSADVSQIRELHRELLDYMVDDPKNRQLTGDARWDMKDANSAMAHATMKKIRDLVQQWADEKHMKPSDLCESMSVDSSIPPGPWKDKIDGKTVSYLDAADAEITFRDMLFTVRQEYMNNLIATVEELPAGPERAAAAAKASDEMDTFTGIYGSTGIKIKLVQAKVEMLTGITAKYQDALTLFFEVRQTQQPNTEMYNQCSAGMLKCFFHIGRIDKADEYMNVFCRTLPVPKIREFFPDFDTYKKLLEADGKTYPAGPQTHFNIKGDDWDYRTKTPDEIKLENLKNNKAYFLESGQTWTPKQEQELKDTAAKVQEEYKELGLDSTGHKIQK